MDEYKKNKFSESSAKYLLKTNNLSALADQPEIISKLRQNMYNLDSYYKTLVRDIQYETVKPFYIWGNERVEGENLEYMVNKLRKYIGQYGGANSEDTGFQLIDWIQVGLDIAGFIPAAGIPIDTLSMIISLIRGQYMDVMFSLINIIPVVGSFIGTPLKYLTKYLSYINRAKKDNNVEEIIESESDEETDETDEYEE